MAVLFSTPVAADEASLEHKYFSALFTYCLPLVLRHREPDLPDAVLSKLLELPDSHGRQFLDNRSVLTNPDGFTQKAFVLRSAVGEIVLARPSPYVCQLHGRTTDTQAVLEKAVPFLIGDGAPFTEVFKGTARAEHTRAFEWNRGAETILVILSDKDPNSGTSTLATVAAARSHPRGEKPNP